jgi:tRNA A37 threonylcarbamoyladenosine biosynthesis protein TsaE
MAWSGGVVAIEWPDRLPRAMDNVISITIEHGDDTSRHISIQFPDSPETQSS